MHMLQIGEFIAATITLIAFCIAGVIFPVDSVTVHEEGIFASTETLSYCGFTLGMFAVGGSALEVHEHGHMIQYNDYGAFAYYTFIAIPSLLSFLTTDTAEEHMSRWAEVQATDLGRTR